MKVSKFFCILVLFSPFTLLFGDIINVPADTSTIQGGIFLADEGDTVLVSEGIYHENIRFAGKAITVASPFILDADTSHLSKTIIDGSLQSHADSGSVVTFNSGEDTNSVLCGFTISGGTGTRLSWPALGLNWHGGGGIVVEKCGAKIVHNIIKGNSLDRSTSFGAGIDISGDDRSDYVIVQNNLIRNNTISNANDAGGAGIAMYTKGTIELMHNIIRDNSLDGEHHSWGAGICIDGAYNLDGDIYIHDNIFKGNQTTGPNAAGGAIFIENQNSIIYNNVIINNHSEVAGGGIQVYRVASQSWFGPPMLVNNTIAHNTAQYGGAIEISGPASGPDSGNAVIINSILWGNSASIEDNEVNLYRNARVEIAFCNIAGGWPGGSNITCDPQFMEVVLGSCDTLFCCLSMTSPCVDAGPDDSLFNDLESHMVAGMAKWPAMGSLRNDLGAHGGPHVYNVESLQEVVEYILHIPAANSQQPLKYNLLQNYPNPFNPSTTIKYALPTAENVNIEIFNTIGQRIETLLDRHMSAGIHQIDFNGQHLPSGIYLYRMKTRTWQEVKKMVLLK